MNADFTGRVEWTGEYGSDECFVRKIVRVTDTYCCGTPAEDKVYESVGCFAGEDWGKGGEGVEFKRVGVIIARIIGADED